MARPALLGAALLASAARADYILYENFASPGCPAGTAFSQTGVRGALFASGPSGGGLGGPPAGCVQSPGTNVWNMLTCSNASYAVIGSYTMAPPCSGAPAATSPVSYAWGCTSQGSTSMSYSCAPGTFAPANTALLRSYSPPTRCSNATLPSVTPLMVVGKPLGCTATGSGGSSGGSVSISASCNATHFTSTSFSGPACTGTVVASTTAPLACQDSATGPSAIVCTAAAASATATATTTAAAVTPTASRSPPPGALTSVTSSATPSASAVALQSNHIETQLFEGAGCAAGALKSKTFQPNTCFASPPSSSYYYSCVNQTYGTQTMFANLNCAGAPTRVGAIPGVGACSPANSGNDVQSRRVLCNAGGFIAPAMSVIIAMHKASDLACTATADTYQAIPIGCIPTLGGAYSTFASCNATAVFQNNYNGGTCNSALQNGTTMGMPLNVCQRATSAGAGPMKFSCNLAATSTPAASHSPDVSPTMSFGATASPSPSLASPTPSPSLQLTTLPAPALGYRVDPRWAPTQQATGAAIVGLEMPPGNLDIFCDQCGAPPTGLDLAFSILVFSEEPASTITIRHMAWSKGGGFKPLPPSETNITSETGSSWISLINVRCRTPGNPSGACAAQVSSSTGKYRVWYTAYSNAAPVAGAAAPTVSPVPLAAGAAGGAVGVVLVCLLLHWLRVVTVPCFNCLCDHRRAGLGKADRRRSFGEVVTNNEAYGEHQFETVLPQRRSAA